MSIVDLRSDTVTRPAPEMRTAMAAAEVGDDVYGEDPTVNALEEKMAAMAGMEAGLFCSSGTQSNLLALMTHCQRGDEYIVGQTAHTYKYEGGAPPFSAASSPSPLHSNPTAPLIWPRRKALSSRMISTLPRPGFSALKTPWEGRFFQ